MAYKINSASNFHFDTTVTINGITYDLLNLESPITFEDESRQWNIEVSHSESTGADQDANVDVASSDPLASGAEDALNQAAQGKDPGASDVTEPTTDVVEIVTTSEEVIETSEPVTPSDADLLASTSDETVSAPAKALDDRATPVTGGFSVDDSRLIATESAVTSTLTETTESAVPVSGSDATAVAVVPDTEVVTTSETTGTDEPVIGDLTPVVADETAPEDASETEVVDADSDGETAEADPTASGGSADDFGHQWASWLADLDTSVFDSETGVTGTDGDVFLPQYADAIADVLGELQTCLETHEASVDPVAAEAVSDLLAGLQAKMEGASDFLI